MRAWLLAKPPVATTIAFALTSMTDCDSLVVAKRMPHTRPSSSRMKALAE